MGSFGGMEWIVIGLAVLLLFGAKRIPELARGLGQGIKEFRKASDDIKREIESGKDGSEDRTPEPAGAPRAGATDRNDNGNVN